MKRYTEELLVDIPADTTWKALTQMHIWLKDLSTNKSVNYHDDGLPFCYTGRTYYVETQEGITMSSQLTCVDAEKRRIDIRAEHKPLVSLLSCEVIAIDETRSKLVRTQAYPGIFGALFTLFYNKRESGETSEYLRVWADFAQKLTP